jgi:hypothetical protein
MLTSRKRIKGKIYKQYTLPLDVEFGRRIEENGGRLYRLRNDCVIIAPPEKLETLLSVLPSLLDTEKKKVEELLQELKSVKV